jgi:hypothetical protein
LNFANPSAKLLDLRGNSTQTAHETESTKRAASM